MTSLDTSGKASERRIIAVCIPAFNEEKTIAKIVIEALDQSDMVIVCDDGSSDLTGVIAEKVGAQLIRHPLNMGKGVALKSLFEKARQTNADVVVTIDADGQHDPGEIDELVQPVLDGFADIVIGSRFLQKGEVPRYRVIGNKALNFLTNIQAGIGVSDSQSGFRAYSRKALDTIRVTEGGIGVDSQIIIDAIRSNLKVAEIPVKVSYEGDASTYNPVRHTTDVVNALIMKAAESNPVLYLGLPGIVSTLIGALIGVRVLNIFYETGLIATGSALLAIALVIIGLLLMVALLIVAALRAFVARLRLETGTKHQYTTPARIASSEQLVQTVFGLSPAYVSI